MTPLPSRVTPIRVRVAFALSVLAAGLMACENSPPKVEAIEVPESSSSAPPKPVQAPPSTAPDSDALKNQLLGLGDQPDDEADPDEVQPDPEISNRDGGRQRRRRTRRQDDGQGTKSRQDPGLELPMPEMPGTSGLSDDAFNEALSDWRGVRACLATRPVAGGERPSGAIRVRFVIAPDGSVRSAKVVDGSSAVARSLAPCVERRAKRVEFPSFEGSEPSKKTAKFVF